MVAAPRRVDARERWNARDDGGARELEISADTVRAHVRNAVTKLHARTRLHAVVMALQRGEIVPHAQDATSGHQRRLSSSSAPIRSLTPAASS